MKKIILFSIPFALLLSCNHNLKPGNYKFNNDSEFTIQKNNQYEFKSLSRAWPKRFSKGSYKIENGLVTFLPDSNYFMSISIKNVAFDPLLIGKQKIIIDDDSGSKLKNFVFYFLDNSLDTFYFDNGYNASYRTNDFNRSNLILYAKLNDSINSIMPGYYNKVVLSNAILFSDLYIEFGKWNVLNITVKVREDMFGFIIPDKYLFKRKSLMMSNWPVYTFSK